MKFRNNHNMKPRKGAQIEGVSMTVPNMTFTISEIMDRQLNGIEPDFDPRQDWDSKGYPMPIIEDLTDVIEAKQFVQDMAEMIKVKAEEFNIKQRKEELKLKEQEFQNWREKQLKEEQAKAKEELAKTVHTE